MVARHFHFRYLVPQITGELTDGAQRLRHRIEIRGFGSFEIRTYKPYDGRNPRTGNAVAVKAKRLPFFKVGKELKERVNAGRPGAGQSAQAAIGRRADGQR